MPQKPIYGADCKKWLANKNINPQTNRTIKINGPTYKTYEKICNDNSKKNKKSTLIKIKPSPLHKLSKVYLFGGFKINFSDKLTPIQASNLITDNFDKKSKMYKGMLVMLKKDPEDRTLFEVLVRNNMKNWEPVGDDYEDHAYEFTDFKL